ncbi:MAG: hypothetical protein KC684_07635, partial [Candidatus Omnitrophica bacterium]|nr:hypothetical protein [Candidatus Omnitrophota bacterium]
MPNEYYYCVRIVLDSGEGRAVIKKATLTGEIIFQKERPLDEGEVLELQRLLKEANIWKVPLARYDYPSEVLSLFEIVRDGEHRLFVQDERFIDLENFFWQFTENLENENGAK